MTILMMPRQCSPLSSPIHDQWPKRCKYCLKDTIRGGIRDWSSKGRGELQNGRGGANPDNPLQKRVAEKLLATLKGRI